VASGPWIFEVWVDGGRVASQRFDVSLPRGTDKLPRGLWSGDTVWGRSPPSEDGVPSVGRIIYANCSGNPRIWNHAQGKDPERFAGSFDVVSFEGTHMLHKFGKHEGSKRGWVESVVWTLVEVEPDLLVGRLSRSVHNRGRASGDKDKQFGVTAYVELRKISGDCMGFDE
jgi:hypothetical protein